MRRRLVAVACLLGAIAVSCADQGPTFQTNPFGAEHVAPGETFPPAVDLDWNGFHVNLEPTVELWAKQTHIDLTQVVKDALANIEGRLHATPSVIAIEAGTFYAIPDVGIGGYTDPYTGHVQISMDGSSPLGVRALLKTWIALSLAHELHHAKRILDGPGYGSTIGETVVTEGEAEAFVFEAYPNPPNIPWSDPLAPADAARVWRQFSAQMNTPDDPVLHEQWFYGKEGLPRWAGYKLGLAIVRSYLAKHPGTTAAQLAMVPAADVLRGYRP
jgi:hypothetical protein